MARKGAEFEELAEVVLIAHSYGGVVACSIACLVPDRVARRVAHPLKRLMDTVSVDYGTLARLRPAYVYCTVDKEPALGFLTSVLVSAERTLQNGWEYLEIPCDHNVFETAPQTIASTLAGPPSHLANALIMQEVFPMLVPVKDIQVNVVIEGQGRPVFCLNHAGTKQSQNGLSANLRNHFTLVHIDLRSTGHSGGVASETTMDMLIDDVEAVRAHLGYEQVAVFGHSALGVLALEYAHRFPDQCSHAIVHGTPPFGPIDWSVRKPYWEELATPERKSIHEANLQRVTDEQIRALPADDQVAARYALNAAQYFYDPTFDPRELFGPTKQDFVGHFFGVLLKDYNPHPFFPEIRCPVFIALGKYDFAVPPALWDGLVERFLNAEAHLFSRSGHWPMLEEAAEFDRLLIDWFRRNPA